jgi:hypothetical protein
VTASEISRADESSNEEAAILGTTEEGYSTPGTSYVGAVLLRDKF